MLSFTVADYFPLSGFNSWAYAGTAGGQVATAAMTSTTGFIEDGVPTTRLRIQVNAHNGTYIESRYFNLAGDGLHVLRRDRTDPRGSQIDDFFGSGVRLTTPTIQNGQSIPYSGSYAASGHGQTWSGSLSGVMSFAGAETVTTSAGTFQTVRVARSANGSVQGNGRSATWQTSETQWWALGLGIVRFSYDQDEQYSDGSSWSETADMRLTGSNLLNQPGSCALAGRGQEIANADSTPIIRDGTSFGQVNIESRIKTRRFDISNTGSGVLAVEGVSISGTHADDFELFRMPGTLLGPGESTFFTIRFDPSAAGVRNAALSLSTSDPTADPFVFALRGRGRALGDIDVRGINKPTSIVSGTGGASAALGTSFGGRVTEGQTFIDRTFIVSNNGLGPLNFSSTSRVRVTGAGAPDFVVVTDIPLSIGAGGSASFTVRFDPTQTGARRALISIVSNDLDTPIFTYRIAGRGL